MIDTLRTLGLTDWSSFAWGALVMFVLICVVVGLWTWGSANAPAAEDYEEEHWA